MGSVWGEGSLRFLVMPWSWKSLLAGQDIGVRGMIGERVRLLRLLGVGGGSTIAMCLCQAVTGVAAAGTALAAGFAVDRAATAVATGRVSVAVPGLVALGLVLLVTHAVDGAAEGLAADVRLRIDGWVRRRARDAASAQATLLDLADPSFQDDVTRTADLGRRSGRVRSPGAAAVGQAVFLGRLLGGVLAAVVLARFSPVVAIAVLVLALINRAILRRQWMHLSNVEDRQSRLRRRVDYWSDLAQDPRSSGEVRLFGLGPWISMRHRRVATAERGPIMRDRMTVMRQQSLIVVLTVAAAVVGLLPPTLAAVSGSISAALLVTYLSAVWAILGQLAGMGHEAFDIEYGRSTVRALDRLLAATRIPPVGQRSAAGSDNVVEIDHVSFTYPGRDHPVLDDCSLTIEAGEVLGVVGPNGAGKTTLVKLIAGLLPQDSGTMRVGRTGTVGVSAVFQDLVRYPLSLRDNVTLAAPEAGTGDAAVIEALRMAGADRLTDLPLGLDTVLQRDLVGGTDLSGGQWQRVAIARAIYAVRSGGRPLVILDEPTANLDVRAETQFYETVVRALPGATVILISHRLSTVRHADRIVLLAGGRIAEEGSHETLVSRRGEYARLFALQAARFRGDDA